MSNPEFSSFLATSICLATSFISSKTITEPLKLYRYFTPWQRRGEWEDHLLPLPLRELTGQRNVKFGDCVIETNDTVIGTEMCEELFTPDSPSMHLGLNGVEIICNSSASHWELRKLSRRLELIQESSKKGGSVYLYSNQQGCDGEGREYFDGCALIAVNGEIVAQASQFSLNDIEVISATVDLDEIWKARYPPARRMQASREPNYPRIQLDVSFTSVGGALPTRELSTVREAVVVKPEEEIGLAAGCWVWDYLRRRRSFRAVSPALMPCLESSSSQCLGSCLPNVTTLESCPESEMLTPKPCR